MFDIVRYTPDKCQEWNQFVAQSKNGTFLFYRQYMDYHADRFHDHSLMIYRKSRLYALLPANGYDDVFASHQGLSYGGLVMDRHARAAEILDVFSLLNAYLVSQGFRQVVYKHIPWIYHQLPSEEDLFALTNVSHARLSTRDIASVVSLHCPLSFTSLRKRGVIFWNKVFSFTPIFRSIFLNKIILFFHLKNLLKNKKTGRGYSYPLPEKNYILYRFQEFIGYLFISIFSRNLILKISYYFQM